MKIAVFVDYWNLQLALNKHIGIINGADDYRASIDWEKLGMTLATKSCGVLGVDPFSLSYEGCYIYTSFNPATDDGKKYKKWAITWLDRQPGNHVEIRERRPKALPRCPACHREISHCPHESCGKPIVATVEKGIDTLLVTDLIRLALGGAFDAAVCASSDADMVPAVQFVQTLGKKVIQAGFPRTGMHLATACWGSFDILKIEGGIERIRQISS
jgi:hypothetical protein